MYTDLIKIGLVIKVRGSSMDKIWPLFVHEKMLNGENYIYASNGPSSIKYTLIQITCKIKNFYINTAD